MKPMLLAATCGATLLLTTTALAQSWTELGPAPIIGGNYTGRIAAIAASPTDPNRFFVGAADGGVWRTADGGTTWEPLTDHMPTTAIGALAIDPSNENIIWAGTGESNYANHSRYGLGLYRSLDGGDTFDQLAVSTFAGRCFSRLLFDPTTPSTMYAAITRAGGFPELAAAKGHPQATGRRGVFKSTDSGLTWTALAGGLPDLSATDLAIDPSAPNTLYAAIGRIFGDPQNGIYKTTDGGATWSVLGGGLPTTGFGRISLALAPSQPQRVYALYAGDSDATGGGSSTLGAWRTDNGGTTWTSLGVPSIQSFGWYYSVVSVSPTNADTVFMGGLSLARSTNAGASFSTVTPPHVDLHALAWDANGDLIAGDDGGVHRTGNLGGSWTSHNTGLGVIQFYAGLSLHPTDPLIFFGGTQDNGSNRRNTATKQWSQVFGGDGGWTQLDQAFPSRVFVEFQGSGNLYRSTNGGNSFSSVGSGISGGDRDAFLPPYLINPVSSDVMLYATQRIYRSVNGGTSFSAISGDLTTGTGAIRALAQSSADPSVVYAATNDGNVQVSMDGGVNFTLIRSSHPGWPRVTRELFIDPQDAQTLYLASAAFNTDQILRTQDAGATWESLDGDLPDLPVNVVVADVRTPVPALVAGTDAGVYYSLDEGQTWNLYGQGLPLAPVIDIRLDLARERMLIGTQGRGAWTVPLRLRRPERRFLQKKVR